MLNSFSLNFKQFKQFVGVTRTLERRQILLHVQAPIEM